MAGVIPAERTGKAGTNGQLDGTALATDNQVTEELEMGPNSIAPCGGEAEASVVGDPGAIGVAKLGAQNFLDFSDVGGAVGGWKTRGEALREGFEPAGDIAGERSGAGYQSNIAASEAAAGE